MSAKKVLVVDDNELIRKIVNTYLSKRGYDVFLCEGPFGVLNKVKEFIPDVILMDLNMPGLSGKTLTDLLRKERTRIGCKLLVFSSEDESIQKEMVSQGHADGYFVKSHSLSGLENKIEELSGSTEECCAVN